jgi:tetratricopeptide (TPR) repeat protein
VSGPASPPSSGPNTSDSLLAVIRAVVSAVIFAIVILVLAGLAVARYRTKSGYAFDPSRHLKKALRAIRSSPELRAKIAKLHRLRLRKDFESAKPIALELSQHDDRAALCEVAVFRYETKEPFPTIVELLDRVLKKPDQDDADLLFFVGSMFLYGPEGYLDRAQSLLERSHALRPNYAPALAQLGFHWWRRKDVWKAIEYTERARALFRDEEPYVENNLAYYYAAARRNLEDALVLARKLVRRNPKNADFQDTLGKVLYEIGDYHAAVRELLEANRLSGGADAGITENLRVAVSKEKEDLDTQNTRGQATRVPTGS